jgi:dynein heavy chain 1
LGSHLLRDVRNDLNEILAVCRGEQKQNNHSRALTSALNKGQVPQSWMRYVVPKSVTSMSWMSDFVARVKQLSRLSSSDNLREQEIWLGGMFAPEAYVTATRQLVAQSNGWSLEQLHMHISVNAAKQPDAFTISGLRAIGFECKTSNRVGLIDEVQSDIDTIHFWWNREAGANGEVPLPVYLYTNRSNLLFTFDFVPENFEKSLIYERGVAVACNANLN